MRHQLIRRKWRECSVLPKLIYSVPHYYDTTSSVFRWNVGLCYFWGSPHAVWIHFIELNSGSLSSRRMCWVQTAWITLEDLWGLDDWVLSQYSLFSFFEKYALSSVNSPTNWNHLKHLSYPVSIFIKCKPGYNSSFFLLQTIYLLSAPKLVSLGHSAIFAWLRLHYTFHSS